MHFSYYNLYLMIVQKVYLSSNLGPRFSVKEHNKKNIYLTKKKQEFTV